MIEQVDALREVSKYYISIKFNNETAYKQTKSIN